MPFRSALSVAILFAITSPAFADTDIVVDDFESYANPAALQAAWVPSAGAGDPANSTFLTVPADAVYTNYDGQAAVFDGTIGIGAGSVNEWGEDFNVAPSATQNVELTVDLGHDFISANKKLTLGLRGPAGIIELGFWNQAPVAPADQYAYRTVTFNSGDSAWEAFNLDEDLNSVSEIGESAFHRFKAIITETDITFTLDLYADGINNAASAGSAADYDNDGDVDGNDFLVLQRDGLDIEAWKSDYGTSSGGNVLGVDATNVVPAVANSGGFDSLRFGIPSGLGSSADPFLGVDNVSLRMVDIVVGQSAAASVPEPSSMILALLAFAQIGLVSRRR